MAYSTIRPARGTLYEWQTINPLLDEGELVIEVPDTGVGTGLSKFKIGDGNRHYNELPYAFDGSSANSIIGGDAIYSCLISLRSTSRENWLLADPVLAQHEITYDTTANAFKIGNGNSRWSELPYTKSGPFCSDLDEDWSGELDFGYEEPEVGSDYRSILEAQGYPQPLLPDGWDDDIIMPEDYSDPDDENSENSSVVGSSDDSNIDIEDDTVEKEDTEES